MNRIGVHRWFHSVHFTQTKFFPANVNNGHQCRSSLGSKRSRLATGVETADQEASSHPPMVALADTARYPELRSIPASQGAGKQPVTRGAGSSEICRPKSPRRGG